MMKIQLVLLIAISCVFIQSTWGLSCPCWRATPRCLTPDLIEDCPYGLTSDACGCCPRCAKGPEQVCGGPWRVKGKCGEGYACVPNDGVLRFHFTGKCQANELVVLELFEPEALKPSEPEAVKPSAPEAVKPSEPKAMKPSEHEAVNPSELKAVNLSELEAVKASEP